MADILEVTLLDGTTEIVTPEEAKQMRRDGELLIPEPDGKALTLGDVYGVTGT